MTESNIVRPLHIGKFIPPPYAGVEAHIDSLLRSLLPEFNVTLAAAKSPGISELLPYKVLEASSFGKFASATISPGILKIVKDEFISGRSNLLHIHSPNPWGDFAAISLPKNFPVVISWHSDIVRQKNIMKFYKYIQNKAIQRADKILVATPNHYLSSVQLHNFNVESKIVHIPYGIDFSSLHNIPMDYEFMNMLKRFALNRPIILSVGRHVSYKGFSYLLSAFSKIKNDAVLLMVGSGPLTASLIQQSMDYGVANDVLFVGEVNLPQLVTSYAASTIFCLPSITQAEAFGIASAEAMSFGKPTIVCNLRNGVNYLNKHEITSLVVEPCNANELSAAIDDLLSSPALIDQMGAKAKEWVTHEFSIEAMRSAVANVYYSLIP